MPHLQDSINKSPVWGTMQHRCHTYKTRYRCGGLCNTDATPTRLDTQVAGVGDYATPMPHLQDSINKSPVWGTMQHQCHTYKTRYTSRRCGGLCNTSATPTRLDTQVAGVRDYATPMPHIQDSINKSPVWGTMQHKCHTYKTR